MTNPAQPADRRTLLQSSLQALDAMEAKLKAAERARTEPIAIIGMSCRFPGGVDSPESFWELLREGRDAVSELPADRRAIVAAFGVNPDNGPGKPAWQGGFLDNIGLFDPQLFGITPREAQTMDPQQRLVLEVSWEAIERAGYAPDSLAGSRTGVFLGISTNDYGDIVRQQGYDHLDAYAATGGSMNVAAGRISFTLGLQGPAMAIDTACSSSLVAVHLAVQSLRNHESNLALAGGVNAVLMPDGFVSFSSWGMMASDGRCKAFDTRADGFVRAEGCGMLLLKRLSEAQADGDQILAVIRGSAVNQDGRSSGLTVPNGRAQQAMLQQALDNAGLEPAQIQYIEAHGTGTALGDPIEVEAIGVVLGRGRASDQPLFLSSVKTNIGHAESAAGIAAMIKVILAMQHAEIPPMLHLRERSPKIPWPDFQIDIPVTPTSWPASNGLRIAGVSGFGFSGTNAHVLLASAPELAPPKQPAARSRHLLTLSAKSAAALTAAAARLAAHLAAHPDLDPAAVCATANTGRTHFAHRLAINGASIAELSDQLGAFGTNAVAASAVSGRAQAGQLRVAFLFTGQGSQYAGMGQGLYASEPVFRAALDRCAELLAPHVDLPLIELLFGAQAAKLDQTAYTQPALFALEYALSELWRSWGVTPSVVIGHSVGEYVAAVVAGVLSLEDGLRLIATRGRLMQSLPTGGAMATIFAPEAQVRDALALHAEHLAIAAINGPEHTVISGTAEAVEAVMEWFAATGARVQRLAVSHAFHSSLMEPILDSFERTVAGVTLRSPRLTLISNLSGEPAGDEILTPAYWRQHLREAVRFGAGVQALQRQGVDAMIEIGPHPVMLGMAQQMADPAAPTPGLPSLRKNRDDTRQMLESLGQLYVRGATIHWAALGHGRSGQKITLPTYPFQRVRYWIDLPPYQARGAREQAQGEHPLLGRRTRSPLLRETIFEREILASEPSFLADHRVFGATVFPGTAYIELALAAAASAGPSPLHVLNLNIRAPLLLDDAPYSLQLVLTPEESGEQALQIIGFRADDPAAMQTHATGIVRSGPISAQPAQANLAALRAACPEQVDTSEFYADLARRGLEYGPAFRGVSELYRGQGVALGLVRLPDAAGASDAYQIHPALLDACFHVIGASMASGEAGVPIGIAGLRLFKPAPSAVWCYVERVQTTGTSAQTYNCRLLLLDEMGQTVAELERLEIVRASQGSWARDSLAPWFHQLAWKPQPLAPAAANLAGRWLVLTDCAQAADLLVQQLAALGAMVTLVHPGPRTVACRPGCWQANMADPQALEPILDTVGALRGVVCLWAAAAPGGDLTTDSLMARQALACAGTLHLVQALVRRGGDLPRLWIATRGTQSVDTSAALVDPADATLWGFGRVVMLEHPGLDCTLVDLDPLADDITALVDQVRAPDHERQIALRGGGRFVARLLKRAPAGLPLPAAEPYALTLSERGMLDKLAYQPGTAGEPGPGEVAINVYATGLNFRDVLNVLGMYPGDPGPPGIECAGMIAAVGAGVEGLTIGDAVVGLAPGSFDAVVITRAHLVAHKPANLSFADGASVPSAFLTANYGLHTLAGLQAGERVLIHAAAGGVGLAAVQIAQRLGAEIYATAGSPAKHAYLRSLGIQHIFSSRQADFREQLLALTGGRGVDVVLNSLSEDFISDSFAALAPNGRFLEIGKRGIWTAEQAAQARPDVRYTPYDLGDVLRDDPELIKSMLETLLGMMAEGRLASLPLRAFPAEETIEAFRYMSQAKHIGKVVVTHRPAGWAGPVRADCTYLITGGLGGIGLRVGAWLADRGARHLALIGRREPSPAAAAAIAALRDQGVEVLVSAADVSQKGDLGRLLDQIAALGLPLRGVFHAAGTLDDGALPQQRWERFATVFAPKLAGAWNLHLATRGAPLDHFVLFSSASAILGKAGQSNYAAANAFLDALAHWRRAEGLPATSINWGAWGEVGMAAALSASHQKQIAGRGVDLIAPESGVLALERVLANGDVQPAVLPMRWASVLEQFADSTVPPLFAEIARAMPPRPSRTAAVDEVSTFRQQLFAAPDAGRLKLLVERLRLHVARVMGMDVQATDTSRSLSDLGIDSLMAVEFKNRIDGDLRGSVPVTTLLAGPSIEELADELIGQIATPAVVAVASTTAVGAASNGQASSPEEILANLAQLSDDQVDAMLETMLKNQGSST